MAPVACCNESLRSFPGVSGGNSISTSYFCFLFDVMKLKLGSFLFKHKEKSFILDLRNP